MLPSQRPLFDVPREVCYLNAAAFGPLPRTVQEAGERGAARKSRPWDMVDWQGGAKAQSERARAAVQRMIELPKPSRPARYDLVKARHHVAVELI